MSPSSPAPLGYARCMVALGASALSALLGSQLLAPSLGATAGVHVLLAVGVMPLVLGAMGYFTPALTQTRPPPVWLSAAPVLALLAGVVAVGALRGSLAWVSLAAPMAGASAVGLLMWMSARARAGLGDPHPCLRWYQAALVCLVLALIAIQVAVLKPAWWLPLRRLHLHLNLLGFVGLAAVGTLQVLLPTVAGYSDPNAARRLHRDLPAALVGAVLIAVGAAWPTLRGASYVGAACWAVPLGGLAIDLARHRRQLSLSFSSPALPLVGALLGLCLSLLAGALGTRIGVEPRALLGLFAIGFLFPLITGALAHLLPVWRWPGSPSPARLRAGRILTWAGGLRALVFPAAGVAYAFGVAEAAHVAGVVLLTFLAQAVVAIAWPTRAPDRDAEGPA